MNTQLATRFRYGRTNSTEGGSLSLSMASARGPLSETELRQFVPSIFAETAHASRSDRYAYIPTIDVVRGLAGEGFAPVFACEAKARMADKHGYTKHMVRFRRGDVSAAASTRAAVGAVPELVMVNSHDGSTRYQFFAGTFRFICANGAIVGTGYAEVSIRHTGRVVEEAIAGAFEVSSDFGRIVNTMGTMEATKLGRDAQHAFAESALALKYWDDEANELRAPIRADQLLIPRRYEDDKDDLWTVTNVVQENLIRGGLRGRTTDANGNRRRTTTRAVNGIDGNVKLNRALWTLSEKMAELTGHPITPATAA